MVRTRFAPSPTGSLHVGGLRTALYDFLFARKHGGKFILRIEDTDQKREKKGAVESLIAALHWAGLDFDEGPGKEGGFGPYIQSQRTHLYKKFADQLLAGGHAYHCFCTAERLSQMRLEQEEHKQAPMYDRKCAGLKKEEMEKLMEKKMPFVVRQKIGIRDQGSEIKHVWWNDLVRGEVKFEIDKIDDQVLLKSDGFPTYHLANVVDDHLMEITHVIRGEEWLSSTPKHLLLYQALGWQPPSFAHLPLLLNKDRSKLSKRQGDVAVEDYRAKGYLPEALVNFVAMLGWHPGEKAEGPKGAPAQEIFSFAELAEKFTLEKVHRGGAVFDLEKLDWMNWQWQRKKFLEAPGDHGGKLVALAAPHIPKEWLHDKDFLKRCLQTVEEKLLQKPALSKDYIKFYFYIGLADASLLCNPKMKVDKETAKTALIEAMAALKSFEKFDDMEALKSCLAAVVAKLGCKNGQVFWPVRVALTGEQFSPGVFEVLWALGKEKSLERLKKALASL